LAIVKALLDGSIERSHRENEGYPPVQTGIFIHASVNIYYCLPLLSLPIDLPRP
jgi:hypothetical protein